MFDIFDFMHTPRQKALKEISGTGHQYTREEIDVMVSLRSSDQELYNMILKFGPGYRACPTCLGECGQCNTSISNTRLIDLRVHPNYKKGWNKLISTAIRS